MTQLVLAHGSYLVIALVLVLTGAGLPVPEEVPVITAGVMASHGQLHPWLAFVVCLAGAVVGDCVMYTIGFYFGRNVVREHRYWAYFVTPEREAHMEELICRHGLKVLFLARFLVGLRSPVYLTAGILRVPFRRFFFFDLFCATAVIGTCFLLSFYYGQPIFRWIRGAQITVTVIAVVALLALGIYLWRLHRKYAPRITAAAACDPAGSNGEASSASTPETTAPQAEGPKKEEANQNGSEPTPPSCDKPRDKLGSPVSGRLR